jgi:hypothetical protein
MLLLSPQSEDLGLRIHAGNRSGQEQNRDHTVGGDPFLFMDSAIITIPATTAITPLIAQRLWPVIKLPGRTLIPWKNQIPPNIKSNTPRILRIAFMADPFIRASLAGAFSFFLDRSS